MKINLTNSQADVQIIADLIKNLKLDTKPAFMSTDGSIELYENNSFVMIVNWNSNTVEIKES